MTIRLDHPKARALSGGAEHASKTERKYYLMQGGQWLHWSGTAMTSKRSQAWAGSIEQARKCRARFDAAAGCKAISVNATLPTPLSQEA